MLLCPPRQSVPDTRSSDRESPASDCGQTGTLKIIVDY